MLLLDKLVTARDLVLQARDDFVEVAMMAGIVLGVWVGSVLIADGTKRLIGPRPEVPKHGNMLAQ